MPRYVPARGDIVWFTFDPQAGREQVGRRPALVLSPALYNRRASLALVCPITSHVKGYPFEVPLPKGLLVSGVVLPDHVKRADGRCGVPASLPRPRTLSWRRSPRSFAHCWACKNGALGSIDTRRTEPGRS